MRPFAMSLRVRDCPAELAGSNRIFLHTDELKKLAGGMGDGRTLYAQANRGLVFMLAESQLVVAGNAMLDPVQRSSVKISLNERVSLTPVPANLSGESFLRSVTFSVDFPLASQRDSLPIESSDLSDVIQTSLRGAVLAVNQYVLVVKNGTRLRLRVVEFKEESSTSSDRDGSVSVLGASTRVQCRTYGNSPVVLRNAASRAREGSVPSEERGEYGASNAAGGSAGAASAKRAFAQVACHRQPSSWSQFFFSIPLIFTGARQNSMKIHPGGNPGANLKSISHSGRWHLNGS